MVTTTAKFTRADYMALPEGFPAELIAGELVKSPAPTWSHQRIVGRLHLALCSLVDPDRVALSPIDVFVDDLNVLQPDLAVAPEPVPADAPDIGIPMLVIEVLSPSTARRDREVKSAIYLDAGVREVVLVDPRARAVEIVTKGGTTLFRGGKEASPATLPGFAIVLDELLGD